MTEIAMTARQADVLSLVRLGHRQQEIAAGLGMSKQHVSQVVRQLADAGLVIAAGRGRYLAAVSPNEYQRRPVSVEAVRFTEGSAAGSIINWAEFGGALIKRVFVETQDRVVGLVVPVGGKSRQASLGDWIVRDAHGKFEVLTHEAFLDAFEAVGSDD